MLKILAIDDIKDNLVSLKALLRNLLPDCKVVTALSGPEGLKKAESELPDIILLDIIMPAMDGFEVCENLKSNQKTKHIPIILITAIKTDAKSRVEGLERGADAFLSKPIDESELAAQVKSMFRLKRAEESLRKEKDLLEELVRERTKSLRESEGKYRLLIENANESISIAQDGVFKFINPKTVEITGFTFEELKHKPFLEIIHPEDREAVAERHRKRLAGEKVPNLYDIRIVDKQGKVKWIQINAVLFKWEGRPATLNFLSDITARKLSEGKIIASLQEKEVLLREVHHRVKNNMQVISSLLNIQSRHIDNPQAREKFRESQSRIKSMALIHEKLYKSENLSMVDFSSYIQNLVVHLYHFYGRSPDKINFVIKSREVFLNVNKAIPSGLIVNELVSNALKHAFPNQKQGDLRIEFHNSGGKFKLLVQDNGIGFPEKLDFRNTETLGLQLVDMLVGQLEGTIRRLECQGTGFEIQFEDTGKKLAGIE